MREEPHPLFLAQAPTLQGLREEAEGGKSCARSPIPEILRGIKREKEVIYVCVLVGHILTPWVVL